MTKKSKYVNTKLVRYLFFYCNTSD